MGDRSNRQVHPSLSLCVTYICEELPDRLWIAQYVDGCAGRITGNRFQEERTTFRAIPEEPEICAFA